jgi:hypothetical protein
MNEYIFRPDSSELSIRQHTSTYVSIRQQGKERVHLPPRQLRAQHTSAYVSIRQSAYVSIRQQVNERVHLPPRQL